MRCGVQVSAAPKHGEVMPQLPEYSTLPKSPTNNEQLSSFSEAQMQSGDSEVNPLFPSAAIGDGAVGDSRFGGRTKMTDGLSDTTALKHTYASEFSGFYAGNSTSALYPHKEEPLSLIHI